MRDLPNMGEKERGTPDITVVPDAASPSSSRDLTVKHEDNTRPGLGPAPAPATGWMMTWRHFIYEKWRLCAVIALAVMVSRFSSRG